MLAASHTASLSTAISPPFVGSISLPAAGPMPDSTVTQLYLMPGFPMECQVATLDWGSSRWRGQLYRGPEQTKWVKELCACTAGPSTVRMAV